MFANINFYPLNYYYCPNHYTYFYNNFRALLNIAACVCRLSTGIS